jgi:hypothetical protein
VEVVDDAAGVTYYFPCRAWLDKKQGDGVIERLLKVRRVYARFDVIDKVQVRAGALVPLWILQSSRLGGVHGMSEFEVPVGV